MRSVLVVATLDELNLSTNTLLIVTSDNGGVIDDGYLDVTPNNQAVSGPLRGGKYSLFDAGTRVPFIVSWSGKIEPGVSDALVSQMDFLASFAALTGQSLPSGDFDSENLLDTLMGKTLKGRDAIILEAMRNTCLRTTEWYYIPPHSGPAIQKEVNIETGLLPLPQLYRIVNDVGQRTNLAADHPEVVSRLDAQYREAMGEYLPVKPIKRQELE